MFQIKHTWNSVLRSSPAWAQEACEHCGRSWPEEFEAYLLGDERQFCPVCGWEEVEAHPLTEEPQLFPVFGWEEEVVAL